MSKITIEEKQYHCRDNETLLEALLRQGKEISFSCKSGACHACLMKVSEGKPSKASQQGLSSRLQQKNYFLPCLCHPETDMAIEKPLKSDLSCMAVVHKKKQVASDIWIFQVEPSVELFYHAGQFININNQNGVIRSYSLSSVPHQDYYLELHIKRHADGMMSRWLVDDVQVGDEIELTRPDGHNFYQAKPKASLLLVASGTGLAPLIGIARDALHSGHTGEIFLYHGVKNKDYLYQDEKLIQLEKRYPAFHYQPCIASEQTVQQAVRTAHADLTGWIVHMSGNPALMTDMELLVTELGAESGSIYSDPFTLRDFSKSSDMTDDSEQSNQHGQEVDYPPPDLEIWKALGEGKLLKVILDDFYDAVFIDPVLSPYFHNSTSQRAKEKVYSFYRRLFSGDRVFFGDRPRNAHHWMVISDEIFDYREALIKSFMVKHGLPDEIIQRWLSLEELYRPDMVKKKARGRQVGEYETPAEGYGTIELSTGGMCDSCHSEIKSGITVTYHLRTGLVYCSACYTGETPDDIVA